MAVSKNDNNPSLGIEAQCAIKAPASPQLDRLGPSLDNPLWQFACEFYAGVGIETTLLTLQDEHGADINLILQALWLATLGQPWTLACIPADYDQWMAEQVQPLRAMRRNMKVNWPEQKGKGFEDFRQQVKKLELKAEQFALGMLYLVAPVSPDEVEEPFNRALALSNLDTLAEYFTLSSAKFEQLKALL